MTMDNTPDKYTFIKPCWIFYAASIVKDELVWFMFLKTQRITFWCVLKTVLVL